MNAIKSCCLFLTLSSVLALGGCMDITGRGPAPLAKTIGTQTESTHERVGHVYCMRGWLGIFSTGMDALADKIDSQVSARAVSVADEEWIRLAWWIEKQYNAGEIGGEPLVLLGHSWGADDMIRVAAYLKTKNITVDLLVLLDPVDPPAVPSNVKRVYCIYKSHPDTDSMPFWRGVPITVADKDATPYVNINLRTTDVGFDTTAIGHVNIEKSAGVHNMIMEQIKLTCPLRSAWNNGHPTTPTVSAAAPASTIQPEPAAVTPRTPVPTIMATP